jgi:hypothetical protein
MSFLSGDWAVSLNDITLGSSDSTVDIHLDALCYGDVNAS